MGLVTNLTSQQYADILGSFTLKFPRKYGAERLRKGERKVKISGTIKPEQEKWINRMIDEGKYYSISHILQEGIRLLQDKDNGK